MAIKKGFAILTALSFASAGVIPHHEIGFAESYASSNLISLGHGGGFGDDGHDGGDDGGHGGIVLAGFADGGHGGGFGDGGHGGGFGDGGHGGGFGAGGHGGGFGDGGHGGGFGDGGFGGHGFDHGVALIAAPVVAPVLAHADSGKEADHHAYPKYEFSYGVADGHTGDHKSQHEERDGDTVKGSYSLHEPDGTIRTVHYTADKHNGFNAHVERSGHAVHPHVIPVKAVVATPVFDGHGGHGDYKY